MTISERIGEAEWCDFLEWRGDAHFGTAEAELSLFVNWLLSTPTGQQALKRINNAPRQLWLDFGAL